MSDDAHSMASVSAVWLSALPTGKKARKGRAAKISKAVDRRELRVTKRTEQCNFRCRADIKAGILAAAKAEGIPFAEWMERALEAALEAGGHHAP